jgi:putative hydrolase of the HAD superfamily
MTKNEKVSLVQCIRELSGPLEPLAVSLSPEWEALVSSVLPKEIRAILFDLYGTLFISGAGDIAVTPETAPAAPAASFPGEGEPSLEKLTAFFREAVKRRHEGLRAAGNAWPEVVVEEIWATYQGPLPEKWGTPQPRNLALRFELAVNPVYPMPGSLEALRMLQSRGLVLGILSNAQFFSPLLFDAFFDASPEELGFDPELLIYSYLEGEAKPSPRLFTKARDILARRGIAANETLFIGNDMRNDIVPAADVGFKTALFAGDRRSLRLREDDSSCGGKPSLVLKDLQTLTGGR